MRRALDWAETLDLNPLRVRNELRMKGVKHYVEYLNLLYYVYRWRPDSELGQRAQQRALEVLLVTDEEAYHGLDSVGARRFREDSMSYLRGCFVAKQMGKDVGGYRREVEEVLPSIQRALPTRGVDQRMGFALLFKQLDLPQPETEEEIYPEYLIAKRVPITYYYRSRGRPYDITHEIFAMTERGQRPFPFPSGTDERYAKMTVRYLLKKSMQKGMLDLAAELLVNLAFLGEGNSKLASQAREFLIQRQNPDGSFGKYDPEKARRANGNPRYDVRIGSYLHTTMVSVWALSETTPSQ